MHPLHTEVINYASARSESLAALFYLASAYCYLRSQPWLTRSALWLSLSSLLFACGLLTKEVAVTLPFTVIALNLYIARSSFHGESWVHVLKSLLPRLKHLTIFPVIILVYLIVYQQVTDSTSLSPLSTENAVRPWNSQLATQAKAIVYYILGAVFPVRMSVYPQFQEAPTLLGAIPLLSSSLVAMLCIGAWRLRRLVSAVPIGVAWFLIALIPTSIIPLHILVNDHRPYLSLFGFTLAFWALATRFNRRWILWALCGLLALLSHQRDAAWSNEITLWRDATEKGPLVPEAHFNLGHAHHMAGDVTAAKVAYERAVELSPRYTRAQINLGAIYREQGNNEAAMAAFQHALSGSPTSVEALNNLALTHASEGSHETAIELYEQAIEVESSRAELWLNLGLSLRDVGPQGSGDCHLETRSRARSTDQRSVSSPIDTLTYCCTTGSWGKKYRQAQSAAFTHSYTPVLRYRMPLSHRMVTTLWSGASSAATSAALTTLAPADMPTRSPSSRASRRDIR